MNVYELFQLCFSSSVIQQIHSGEWNYNLTMKAYLKPDREEAIQSSTDIQLDKKIWVELRTDGLNGNTVLVVTDSCWATNQPSPSGSLRYDLIINGWETHTCLAD